MATVIGDRDVLLLGSSQRALNPLGSDILLSLSAPLFKVDTQGNGLPSTIKVIASLISISGTVSWSASGATVTDNHDNTANVAFSSLTGTSCTITASLTVNGQTFTKSTTINKLTDGAAGGAGATGSQYATVYLYQYATSTPAKPNGTSGYTWATGVNSTYSGTDQWQTNPGNPGGAGMRLYVAAAQITAPGGTASTVVSYANSVVQVWSQNGNDGVSGIQSNTVLVYQWAASIPAGPSGTTTYTWCNGSIAAVPSGWTLTPGVAPSQGITLWAARVYLTDSATNATTTLNWTTAAVIAVGSSGSNGAAGPQGASYVTAYCASSTGSATSAPSPTTGKTSLPATNSGGITGTWSATVPTLTAGQYLYQTDGIYDPTTNQVTWSIPYWSSLKVGSLSAITANLGSVNAGNIDLGSSGTSWHVDATGNMWSGASTYAAAPFKVSNTGAMTATTGVLQGINVSDKNGNVILDAGLTLAQQASVNPNIVPRLSSWPTGGRYGNALMYYNTTYPALNGENILLPNAATGVYVAYESAAIGIPAGAWYTVSFTATTEANSPSTGSLSVDLYGQNGAVSTTGLSVAPPGWNLNGGKGQRYTFSEQMPGNSDGTARLRFINNGGSERLQIRIWDVKVEYGQKATPWCDNIITPSTASSFMQNSAIGNAQIANLAVSLAKIDTATISNLSAMSATIGTLRTTTSGARIEISDNLIVGYRSNNTMSFKISS